MNRNHLLWWIINHLEKRHPHVLTELTQIPDKFNADATQTVGDAFHEAWFRKDATDAYAEEAAKL